MIKKQGKKKYKSSKAHRVYRFNRTGEDIEMLNERKHEGKTASSSQKYKDHIDGA